MSMSSPPISPSTSPSFTAYEQTQRAINAVQNKAPIEDIDFTIHVMEDGTEVSTQERVCKGIFRRLGMKAHLFN